MATRKIKNSDGIVSRLIDLMGGPSGSKAQFARDVGVSNAHVANWLKGQLPRADQLLEIARKFDTTVEWLLTGEGPRTIEDQFALSQSFVKSRGSEEDASRYDDPETQRKAKKILRKMNQEKSKDLLLAAAEERALQAEAKLTEIRKALEGITERLKDP